MPPWPNRPDSSASDGQYAGERESQAYSNVPSSPTPTGDPLQQQQQPARSSTLQPGPRQNYVSSPLNPNSNVIGSRSRPGSWGASQGLDKLAIVDDGSGGSSSSSGGNATTNDRDAIKAILSSSAAGGLGPYSPLQRGSYAPGSYAPPAHNRFSTLSSVGSVLSLSDSKYPSMYIPNSNTQLSGSFFPYSDTPHIDYATNQFTPDEDDALHEPEPKGYKPGIGPMNWRGLLNMAFILLIVLALVALFAGYPIVSYFQTGDTWYAVAVGVNSTGQAADLPNLPKLIDVETPQDAYTRVGFDGQDYDLVFSDEFNTPGRTFYPGDDPFWEASDLYYWATKDLEWYDPDAVTTRDGSLVLTLSAANEHNLAYKSGMLQSWNKFCFTGGYVEVKVLFPGDELAQGFWPAAWTMGNLGRPGYGATTDGTWPYTYKSCDVGTLANQTDPNGNPTTAQTSGKPSSNGVLSYLPGQRLSACTCPGSEHPGPDVSVGRGAPEIDIFEAERSKTGGPGGQTSQSSQYAPFSNAYEYDAQYTTIYSPERTYANTFKGSATQQSISSLTDMDSSWFEKSPNANYTVYGLEYMPDPNNGDNSFISWVAGGRRSWGLTGAVAGADPTVLIGRRLISEEPMSLILNLGISPGFQAVVESTLAIPAELKFDYVRVYQRKGSKNIGCDPKDHPTAKYINDHINAYTNVNYTTWTQAGYTNPANSLTTICA